MGLMDLFLGKLNRLAEIDVNLQDQTTPDIILKMHRVLGCFTFDGIQNRDSFILNVLSGHGASALEIVVPDSLAAFGDNDFIGFMIEGHIVKYENKLKNNIL